MSVDDDHGLLDDAASANDDGPGECKYGRFRMHDRTGADGDVALEVDVLADHGL